MSAFFAAAWALIQANQGLILGILGAAGLSGLSAYVAANPDTKLAAAIRWILPYLQHNKLQGWSDDQVKK